MAFEDIARDAERLCQLIGRWQAGLPVSEIERQLVLDKLKTLYDQVVFMPVVRLDGSGSESPAAAGEPEACHTASAAEPEPACPDTETVPTRRRLDKSVIHTLYEEEVTVENTPDEPAVSVAESVMPADTAAVPVPVAIDFDPDDLVAEQPPVTEGTNECARTSGTSVPGERLEPSVQQMSDTKAEEAEAVRPVRVLGEVINAGCHTLGEAMQRGAGDERGGRLGCEHIDDLHKAIGINDEFMLMRDLFDGDRERYRAAIDRLNAFEDLDDAMLYIHSTYTWQPDGEAARILVDLLCRKLL